MGFRSLRAVDRKPYDQWYQLFPSVENRILDLHYLPQCQEARGAAFIFNLAADMGGMGFIETHKAECMLSVLISTHMLLAAKEVGTERRIFKNSAAKGPTIVRYKSVATN